MFITWLVFTIVVAVVANMLNRNPWVFAGISLVFTPVTSAVALFVWHNWLDARD
ncbi:MAG: hypothetical protein JXR12_06310 [Neptunomonas phycophila]|uniref:hypothetical protein n=1 Tax=Neptunomonas phycophila TaxID=1572645 RepID=UPI003B8B6E02